MENYLKYIKYKTKYIKLKKLYGGTDIIRNDTQKKENNQNESINIKSKIPTIRPIIKNRISLVNNQFEILNNLQPEEEIQIINSQQDTKPSISQIHEVEPIQIINSQQDTKSIHEVEPTQIINSQQDTKHKDIPMLFYEPSELIIVNPIFKEQSERNINEWRQLINNSKKNNKCPKKCLDFEKLLDDLFEKNKYKLNVNIIEELEKNNIKLYRKGNIKKIDNYSKNNSRQNYGKNDYHGYISRLVYKYNNTDLGIEIYTQRIGYKNQIRVADIKYMLKNGTISENGYFIGLGYSESNLWHFDIVIGGKKNFGESNFDCAIREINEETGLIVNKLYDFDNNELINTTSIKNYIYIYDPQLDIFSYPIYKSQTREQKQYNKKAKGAAFTYIYCKNLDDTNYFLNNVKFGELGHETLYNLSYANNITLGAFNIKYLINAYD